MNNLFNRAGQTPLRIERKCYTMATVDGERAEITMYGDIVETQPKNFWSGEAIEGQFIIESEFLSDLEQIKHCKELTIRINSYGGDAGVSNLIHNRLRELAGNGTRLICVVDGVAMSGGSLIMCACDTVKVNPSSLIMIHKASSFLCGSYNADELEEGAAQLEAYDKMQAAIYQRKTGLSELEILRMMAETTYLTGKEAVDKGFADEVIENAMPIEIAASADGRTIFVGGKKMYLCPGVFAPDNLPTVTAGNAPDLTNTKPEGIGMKRGDEVMPKTIEELRTEYPELASQLETEATQNAVSAEQQRLREIDEIAVLFDDDLVREAKYGEKACSAQELSYRASVRAAGQGKKFLANLSDDANASNTGNVASAPNGSNAVTETATPEQKLAEARSNVKAALGKKEDKA